MTPATRRTIEAHYRILAAQRARRLARWAETVARLQATPARSDEEHLAKRVALEQASAGYPGT